MRLLRLTTRPAYVAAVPFVELHMTYIQYLLLVWPIYAA